MEFSERTQVFIVASYYKHLTETFGERGKAAFLHWVKHYAMQRGSRMAQRAIRAGETLDYGTLGDPGRRDFGLWDLLPLRRVDPVRRGKEIRNGKHDGDRMHFSRLRVPCDSVSMVSGVSGI